MCEEEVLMWSKQQTEAGTGLIEMTVADRGKRCSISVEYGEESGTSLRGSKGRSTWLKYSSLRKSSR
jgi:hypothetical protein